MEFGHHVLENISLAGDSHIPDKSFSKLVSCACEGVLNEDQRNIVEENSAFKDVDKASLKAAYSGIVTLIIEAAKHDSNEQSISSLLEECKYTADRINDFNKIFLPQKPHIQLLLGKVGSSFPHIVDVDWRLDYYIKNNNVEKVILEST
uniref:COMM domain-containing protein 3 n=1 Tax=Arion vulgaris TaxID=1028688 RepID=A0A0B6YRI5_9EUPU